VFTEPTSVGLDVHSPSVVAAAIDGVAGGVFPGAIDTRQRRVIGWVRSLPEPSARVYEAGQPASAWSGRSRRLESGVRWLPRRRSGGRLVTG
jgi:hypothetical protein